MQIIYDGECPFCSEFVKLVRIREGVSETVELIDARSDDPRAVRARSAYDLDEGMLVQYSGKDYYGSDAVHILSLLSTRQGLFNRAVGLIFSNAKLASLIYPFLKFGRRMTLKILGNSKIASS